MTSFDDQLRHARESREREGALAKQAASKIQELKEISVAGIHRFYRSLAAAHRSDQRVSLQPKSSFVPPRFLPTEPEWRWFRKRLPNPPKITPPPLPPQREAWFLVVDRTAPIHKGDQYGEGLAIVGTATYAWLFEPVAAQLYYASLAMDVATDTPTPPRGPWHEIDACADPLALRPSQAGAQWHTLTVSEAEQSLQAFVRKLESRLTVLDVAWAD